jgi:hypothetical protein
LSKTFAVVGLVLLALGGLVIVYVQRSAGSGLPEGPIWIWVPSPTEIPEYKLNRVSLILNLWGNDTARLDVDFDVSILDLNQFGFAIMQPMRVVKSSSGNLYFGNSDITKPNTTMLANSEFLSRVVFAPRQPGQAVVRISVWWRNAFSVRELGKRVIYLTFLGSTDRPPFMEGLTRDPILNGAVIFTIYYPSNWHLSAADTNPLPDKTYVSPELNGANWQIDFTRPPSNYAESLTIGLSVPEESTWRDWLNVIGTLFVASGAGILSDQVVDLLRQHRTNEFRRDE